MSPECHRHAAQRYRRIAAEQSGSAQRLTALACNHERAADIIDELNKINARVPHATLIDRRANARVLHN